MTDYPGEVAGLPVGGPATLPAVRQWLAIDDDDTDDDDRLELVIAAVNSMVRTWPTAERSVDQDTWRPATVLGATQLVARIDGRRNSPLGVAAFGADGPVYVQRNDPDIAQLLDLGTAYASPAVG